MNVCFCAIGLVTPLNFGAAANSNFGIDASSKRRTKKLTKNNDLQHGHKEKVICCCML